MVYRDEPCPDCTANWAELRRLREKLSERKKAAREARRRRLLAPIRWLFSTWWVRMLKHPAFWAILLVAGMVLAIIRNEMSKPSMKERHEFKAAQMLWAAGAPHEGVTCTPVERGWLCTNGFVELRCYCEKKAPVCHFVE